MGTTVRPLDLPRPRTNLSLDLSRVRTYPGGPTLPALPTLALQLPTQEYLKSKLDYNPETGELTWAYERGGVGMGKPAGHLNKQKGHIQLMLDRRSYLAHRLIWKWMTGEDPQHQIDHVNRNPADNRWENLRQATPAQNTSNRAGWGKYKKGVHKETCGKTFGATITVEGSRLHLGCFDTEDEAHEAYCKAANAIHEQFACTK